MAAAAAKTAQLREEQQQQQHPLHYAMPAEMQLLRLGDERRWQQRVQRRQ